LCEKELGRLTNPGRVDRGLIAKIMWDDAKFGMKHRTDFDLKG